MGGLSGDAWPVSPWPVPRAEGQEVAGGSWEGTSPPLFVCIKPLSDTSFKWPASTGPSDRERGGMCPAASLLRPYHSTAVTDSVVSCLNSVYIYFSPAIINSGCNTAQRGLHSGLGMEVKRRGVGLWGESGLSMQGPHATRQQTNKTLIKESVIIC